MVVADIIARSTRLALASKDDAATATRVQNNHPGGGTSAATA
jgi:hypothetical protein